MINPLKNKLNQGQEIVGIWSIIPSPVVTEILGISGFDFQILDMEHGVYDLQTLDAGVRACEAVGCSPMVRVPGIIPHTVQSVMDLGAHGVVFPQISDEQSARTAIRSMKYFPEGNRGYNPFTRAALYSNPASNEQGKLNNEFGLSMIIIENKDAFAVLDDILRIDGLDIVYLGVYDMSVALGCKGNVHDPQIKSFVESAAAAIIRAGKHVGLMVKTYDEIVAARALGIRCFVYAVDTYLIQKAASEAIGLFRAE